MQKLEKAGEPTMEEILASIRQIISEEPAPRPAPLAGAAAPRAPAVVAPPSPPPQLQTQTIVAPAPVQKVPPVAQAASPGPASPPMIEPVQARQSQLSQGDLASLNTSPTYPDRDTGPATARPMSSPPALPPQPQPQANEPVGLSDGLTGPPRRPSAGLQASMIGVAPTAEQYSRSMWRFGKRPDPAPQPTITLPEPSRAESPEQSPVADTVRTLPAVEPQHPTLSLGPALQEEPRMAPPAAAQTRPPATESLANYNAGRLPSIIGPAVRDDATPQSLQPSPATPNRGTAPSNGEPAPAQVPPPTFAAVLPPQAGPSFAGPSMDARSTMSALAASLAGTGAISHPAAVRDSLEEQGAVVLRAGAPVVAPPQVIPPPPRLPTASIPVETPLESQPSASVAPVPPAMQAMIAPIKSLEDVVVELLRPMLRQWLDENMPRIVEKSLRVELAEQLKKTKS